MRDSLLTLTSSLRLSINTIQQHARVPSECVSSYCAGGTTHRNTSKYKCNSIRDIQSKNVDVSVVDTVVLSDNMSLDVGENRVFQSWVLGLGHLQQSLPLLVQFASVLLQVLWILNQCQTFVGVLLLQSLLKCLEINFLQDCLQSIQGLLQNLVPMGFRHMANNGHQQREGIGLVCLEDRQEIVVLKETHSSVSYLKVKSCNALDQPLEELWNVRLKFLDFTCFKNLQDLSNKHYFLGRVGEWPVTQQPFQQEKSECWILSQEQHRTPHKLFVVKVAGLDLVKWDDNCLEEDHMLLSEWNSKP